MLIRVVSLVDGLLSEMVTNSLERQTRWSMPRRSTSKTSRTPSSRTSSSARRRQTSGRLTLMAQLLAQAQALVTVASFAAGLLVYAPWLIVLLLVALLPVFLGEQHFSARTYRSTSAARRSGASSTTCARRQPAWRPPRK